MRPFVVLKYHSGSVWTRPATTPAEDEPRLENQSSADAYDVKVSPVVVDGETEYRFAWIPMLAREELLPLDGDIRPFESSLTKAISHSVVKRVLACRPPVTRWPILISYRDDSGRIYTTSCEIRVVRMPLELASIVLTHPDDPPTAYRTDWSSAQPVGERY